MLYLLWELINPFKTMQDEQLQNGPGPVDPNENQEQVNQEEGVNQGSGDAERASETLTEDTKEKVAETASAE